MSNPDKGGGISVNSFAVAFPIGILFVAMAIGLFQFKYILPNFNLILWLGVAIFTFFVVFGVNLITQYVQCKSTNPGKAALGALPSVGTAWIGLFIASFATCRIPVASVFAPLIVGESMDVTKDKSNVTLNALKGTNFKECCIAKVSIFDIEAKYPVVMGISYGFYLMFAAFFGMTIGNGFATIC